MHTTKYKLSELLTIKNGKDYKHLKEGDVPVFGSGGYMLSVDSFLYDKESILLPRKGSLSNIQYYDKGKFWTVDTIFYSIINTKLADPYYLYRYIKQLDLSGYDTGASIPSMTQKSYNALKIFLPDLPIQQKIASILSTYDNLIENNTKRIKLLEQLAENLYKEWFVRFRFPGHENTPMENGLPKGWKIEKIGDCVKRFPFGITYKASELEATGKVIVIDQSASECLGYHNYEPSHCASIDTPIILFGDHTCKFCFMVRDFSLGENIIPFRTKNDIFINDFYLYFAIHKLISTEEYKRHWRRLSAMKIIIPNIELQMQFANLIKPNKLLIEQVKEQSTNLTRQRDLLLPRLMSGKLEVTP